MGEVVDAGVFLVLECRLVFLTVDGHQWALLKADEHQLGEWLPEVEVSAFDSCLSSLSLTFSAPAHGSSSARTPAWQSSGMSGGRTPAYGGGGGATVNPYADGSRTAYGGFAGGVSHSRL